MKKSIFTLILSFVVMIASAQTDAIEKYFSKYQDDQNFTVVYVSPKMFQMVTKVLNENDSAEMEDIRDLVAGIKGLRVLKTNVNAAELYEEAIRTINTNEYEVLMTVRDEGQNIRLLTKDSGDIIEELLLIAGGADEFVLLSFIGNLDLKKIGRLAKQLDVEGAEHLEQLEDKE